MARGNNCKPAPFGGKPSGNSTHARHAGKTAPGSPHQMRSTHYCESRHSSSGCSRNAIGSAPHRQQPGDAAQNPCVPRGLSAIVLLAAFVFLFLAQFAFAESDFDGYASKQRAYFQNRVDSWWSMAITAILICIAFNTLVYMLGTTLESQEIKNYAKAEFLQVSASSLMIFFAVALLFQVTDGGSNDVSAFGFMGDLLGNGASSISCTAANGGRFYLWKGDSQFGQGPLAAFKCKLQEKISALDDAYAKIAKNNQKTERLASTTYYLLGVPVWCGDWDLSIHKEVEQAHLIASKIVDLSVSLHAQFVLAEYVQKNMLTVFLPLGLVLRIFPLTRGVGGLFIALGVGFYFVWPAFFLLSDPTFVKASNPASQPLQEGICFSGFRGSAVLLAGIVTTTVDGEPSDLSVVEGKELVYTMTIATMFYPFVALVLTLIFVRAMTPLLGGDMGELMKMVSKLG
ncbi:MAG: hypothetical protein WCY41_04115 [Candidatus Micrarchaeia archaeon]